MTSNTDSIAAHTVDSDLIDEPAAANTVAHTHTQMLISQRVTVTPIIITLAGMGNSSSAAMALAIHGESDD